MSTTTMSGAARLVALAGAGSPRFLVRTVRGMWARQASRHALGRMDDRLLADIGVTREQARREACKPFWMP